ncbi:MAG: lytic transglycosylase domain-containing protein [Thermodesulfobacteriota bacterium]|nr:lytic transglycosylase domain-containing protein [Thermodesulfobacteriota bacterium]
MIRRNIAYILTLALIFFLMPVTIIRADIYKYQDKNGVIHFTNTRPSARKQSKVYIREARPKKTRVFSTTRYDKIITKAAKHNGLLFSLIKSVISVESNFNPRAVSKKGARGLMQIMPGNFRTLAITDPFNPYQNIMGGSLYLKRMMKRYDGQLTWALAAYNAGPEAVDRYGGIPPYRETQAYVKRVLKSLLIYQKGGKV